MKRKVYIAGPMTGFPFFNFPMFDRAAETAEALGFEVFNPAKMDRERGFDESQYPTGDAKDLPAGFLEECIRMDTDIIVNKLHKANGDAIACLPGWQMSTGATAEHSLGKWKGLAILDAGTYLPLYDKPRRIGLCGYAKTGKDTIQQLLGWHRVSFADKLKSDLHEKLAIPVPETPEEKERLRPLYVEYGRTMRKIDPDYWVKRAGPLPLGRHSIITDIRYANELDWAHDNDCIVFRAHRKGIGPANAEEEASIAEIDGRWPYLPIIDNSYAPRSAVFQTLLYLHNHMGYIPNDIWWNQKAGKAA